MRDPHRTDLTLALIALLVLGALGGLWLRGGDDDNRPPPAAGQAALPADPPAPAPVQTPAAPRQAVPDSRLAALGERGPLMGLADNRPETFSDPRFAASGLKRTRVTVSYDDIALGPERLQVLDDYFNAARASGVEPVVTFFRSTRGAKLLPSPPEFRRVFQLFRARYPWVRYFSTWNEANFTAQPTSRDPERTAAFYRIARDECSGGRCTVIACDFRPDGRPRSADWLRRFAAGIGPGPHIWGLSSYVDVNREQTTFTRDFLRRTRGPVWVNEVGAINFFGKGYAPDVNRQTRAMAFLLSRYARLSSRLKRIYVYHWRAAPGNTLFDSALLDLDGNPRPAYYEFMLALGRPVPTQ